ncbi:MAG: DUF3078 domain-containing protein [Calditrichaeota bacterium]|nr:MAG: DUF3078 domain-containing protein [Calditrichota bacterium]
MAKATAIFRAIWLGSMVLFLSTAASLQAGEQKDPLPPGWHKTLVGNLNFTQNRFDNWTQGGEDSWAWQLDLNGKFIHEAPTTRWDNSLKFSFGRTRVGDAGSRKAADELKLESVFTFKLGFYINPYVSVTALTQVAPGFEHLDGQKRSVSNFLDPGYFTQGTGFGYAYQEVFHFRLGMALKETVTRNHPERFTDDPATPELEKTRTEVGAESSSDLNLKLHRNILWTSKLNLFSDFSSLEAVDVTWDNLFTARVTRLIAVNFNFNLFYDRDISPKRQIKQTLSVGLTYSFF